MARTVLTPLATGIPVANLYQSDSGTQSIANNTATAITFDAEAIDTAGGHTTGGSNSRYTVQTGWGGYYLVAGVVFFATGATGIRLCWLKTNGTTDVSASVNRRSPTAAADGDGMPTPSCVLSLAAGDYVELIALHTQGSAVNTYAGAQYRSGLSVAFLRP